MIIALPVKPLWESDLVLKVLTWRMHPHGILSSYPTTAWYPMRRSDVPCTPAGDPRSQDVAPISHPAHVRGLCATCMPGRRQIGAGVLTDGRGGVWWGRQGERCRQEHLATGGPIRRARARSTQGALMQYFERSNETSQCSRGAMRSRTGALLVHT